jgi:hypothetical protein
MVSVWQILDLNNDLASKLEKGNRSKWTNFHLIFLFVNDVFVQFNHFSEHLLERRWTWMQKHNAQTIIGKFHSAQSDISLIITEIVFICQTYDVIFSG